MKITEETILDAITNSAKKRFDFEGFEAGFLHLADGKIMADKMLFMIIVGFVAGKSDEHISSELISQMLVIGLGLDEAWLAEFINDKRRVFKAEIRAMKYVHTMLELQDSPAEVLAQVTKMLNDPEQYK